jgi:hypothetical protein
MAVKVVKIHAAFAVPVVELTVVEAPRCAAIGELSLPNAAEDGIELDIADVEGVVVLSNSSWSSKRSVSVSLMRTGAKWSPFGSARRPKMQGRAGVLLDRGGHHDR